jgi:hypothetical protein
VRPTRAGARRPRGERVKKKPSSGACSSRSYCW